MAGDRSMTIEYKDSKRIVKLSTDTVETITFSDNSFTSGWDKAGTQIATNSGSGEIDWNARVNGTNHSLVHDLQDELGSGVYLSTKYVARFEITIDVIQSGGFSGGNNINFGFSGSDESVGYDGTSQDFHGIKLSHDGGGSGSYIIKHVAVNNSGIGAGTSFAETFTTQTYYVELVRDGDDFTTKLLDSNYSVLTEEESTTVTNIQLQYFKITEDDGFSSSANFSGTVDNIKIWNGVTSISSKPSNVQDNSLLVEKDTARRYWGTDKVTTEAVYTSVTGQSTYEKLSGTAQAYSSEKAGVELVSTANDGKAIKIGKWKLAREGTLSGLAYMKVEDGSGNLKATSTGVDVSSITARTSGYEYVTFTLPTAVKVYNGYRVYIEYTTSDGSGNFLAFAEFYNGSTTIPTGFEFTVYNKRDSGGNNPSGGWADDGLPTLLIPDAIFDDVPASNVTSDSITWTMQPTYQTDFSSSTGWTFKDSAKASISGGSLSFDFEDNSGDDDSCYYDLGSTMSDTKWLLRFKINWTTFDDNSRCWFGLASNTTAQNVAKDFIGLLTHKFSGTANWESMDKSNASLDFAGENSSSTTISTSTDYWVQIRRLTDTTYDIKVYDDSAYTSLVDTVTGTMSASSISGLQYIMFYNRNDHETTYNQVGTIDDLSFYNGVTSIN
jgi:hypothetical protein